MPAQTRLPRRFVSKESPKGTILRRCGPGCLIASSRLACYSAVATSFGRAAGRFAEPLNPPVRELDDELQSGLFARPLDRSLSPAGKSRSRRRDSRCWRRWSRCPPPTNCARGCQTTTWAFDTPKLPTSSASGRGLSIVVSRMGKRGRGHIGTILLLPRYQNCTRAQLWLDCAAVQ
jgi:hypothetical protein